MRRERAESSSTSRHRVVGPCVLPFLFISNIGFHILFLLFSIASTSSQAQHPHFSPLSTPPRSVILSASAGHRLLACLHSQNQSTRHTTGWICSLRRLSLPGWPSREDLPIGHQTSGFHIPSGDRTPFSNASYSKVQHIPNRGQGSNAGEVWVRVGVGSFPT